MMSYEISLLQNPWIAFCSADLQIGVDGDDACQNAHLEMGATMYRVTQRPHDRLLQEAQI